MIDRHLRAVHNDLLDLVGGERTLRLDFADGVEREPLEAEVEGRENLDGDALLAIVLVADLVDRCEQSFELVRLEKVWQQDVALIFEVGSLLR